jgi:glycosyltransferase involved in cell wall biosynthesis
MKNILYLTEVSPFPTCGGKEIRRYSILKALSGSGCNVHAIIGNKNKIDLNPFKMEHVSFYEFTYKSGKLNAIFKYFKIFKKNRKLLRLTRELTARHSIDIAFLDCYFIGQYISFFKKRNIPVIFGTENSQSRLTWMRTDKRVIKKIEKYTNTLLQYIHERLFFNRADAVIVVSDEDLQFHKTFVSENKLVIIPNFLDFSRYTPRDKKDNYIIMTGSFDAYQNKLGLTWFLEQVWDDRLSKLVKLVIAGHHSSGFLEKIKQKNSNLKNVYAAGEVEDITPYISRARTAIVPLLHGSGSRIKILEAMALKTLVISTSTGAEGIDHENTIITADNACDFKNEILKAIEGSSSDYYKTKIGAAYQLALKKYSLESNRKKIERILKNVTP